MADDQFRFTPRVTDSQRLYWSPKEVKKWATIDYRLPVDSPTIGLAVIEADFGIHELVDPNALAELWVRSSDRPKWTRLIQCRSDRVTGSYQLFPFNVTPWLKESRELDVRFRLYGTRSLAHPDPNTPIGPAAAQAMRMTVGQEAKSIRLRVWEDDD